MLFYSLNEEISPSPNVWSDFCNMWMGLMCSESECVTDGDIPIRGHPVLNSLSPASSGYLGDHPGQCSGVFALFKASVEPAIVVHHDSPRIQGANE